MKIAVLLLPAILLMASPSFPMGRSPKSPAPSEPKSSLQLIAEALERGDIDEDTATLYRVYSVFDDSKLPAQYKGSAPIKDGTPVIRDARSRYDSLRPEVQEKLKPYLFPKGRP